MVWDRVEAFENAKMISARVVENYPTHARNTLRMRTLPFAIAGLLKFTMN